MDHAEALEALELAAVEPGGLERLAAGDTPESAALAGHLLDCDVCVAELERLRRLAPRLRQAIVESPPQDLRARTLAYVRERGRARGPAADASRAPVAAEAPTALGPLSATSPGERRGASDADAAPTIDDVPTARPATPAAAGTVLPRRGPARPTLGWFLAAAAAVVIAAGGSGLLVNAARDADVAGARNAAAQLVQLEAATTRVLASSDTKRVTLVDSTNAVRGTLLVAPSSGAIVVTATGLAKPAAGAEYRCWVQLAGGRRVLGVMELAAGLAYWNGWTYGLPALPAGTRFGVSLVTAGGADGGTIVLTGTL